MKKVLSIVLSIVMVLCMMPAMAFADSATYSDIAGTKCEAAVEELAELGVVTGYPDGTYKPEAVVTRAEMAKLIVTALGLNPTAGTSAFKDMDGAKWAIPYVGYAESLGIIEGYGNGMFGPNDPVTYDQAITMVVRAIGYTEDCNEMQGEWPAVFVLKANALDILKGVPTGAAGANRGDVAVLLNNALDADMVYADKDGETKFKNDENGGKVSMEDLLVKAAYAAFGVVTADVVNNAAKNIREHLGAAGKIVYNEEHKAISVSDIKTTFLTGKFVDQATFKTTADETYKVASSLKNTINAKGKAVVSGTAIEAMHNGADVASNNAGSFTLNRVYTIAVTVDGNIITGVLSMQRWDDTYGQKEQVDKADLDQITINKTLLTEEFTLDKNDEIDTDSFLLKGVNSLADIAVDNIVTVYRPMSSPTKITKIEVGTKVVTGEVTKVAGSKYYIDNVPYELASGDDIDEDNVLKAGYEVKVYLDYAGKIFEGSVIDGTAGNYAVILSQSSTDAPATAPTAAKRSIHLFTADGEKLLTVDGKAFEKNGGEWYSNAVSAGAIVKYAVDDANQLVDMTSVAAVDTASNEVVNKQGYFDGHKIADTAVIVKAPTDGALSFDLNKYDEWSVIDKAVILGKTLDDVMYAYNSVSDQIEFMIVSDTVVASAAEYGIVTGPIATLANSKYEVNFFINTTKVDAGITEDSGVLPSSAGALYKITKDTNGEYLFDAATAVASTTSAVEVGADGYVVDVLSGDNGTANSSITSGKKLAIYDNAVVYVYDNSADTYTIGSVSNLKTTGANAVSDIYFYSTAANDKADAWGLVDYIVVVRA